jgi:hypothetical protein
MGTPKKSFTKATIGGMEETLGTAVPRTSRVALTDFSYLLETPTKNPKEVITGRNTTRGFDVDAIDYTSELATNLAANKATGMLLQSLLGFRVAKVQVGCGIFIAYKGDAASCKLVASGSGKTLTSYVGDLGEEETDAGFGTAGVLDLTGKTLGTLVTAINEFSDYEAKVIYGGSTTTAETPVDIVATQAKNHQAVVHFTSADSGVYLDVFRPNFTNTENPTFSIQMDGVGDNQLGSGAVVDTATFSGDLKAKVKATWSLILTKVLNGQTASAVALTEADLDSLKFSEGETYIAGKKYCYTKNVSVSIANNHAADEGYCQGSLSKSKHVRGEFGVTGSMTLTATDKTETINSEDERAKNLSNLVSSLLLIYVGRQLVEGVRSLAIIDLPTIQYTEESKSAGDQAIDQSLSFTAIDIEGYDDFFKIHMLSTDAT